MSERPIRVLHSFPHKIGDGRICEIAWQQVRWSAAAGADVTVYPGVLHKPFPEPVRVRPTLARGRFRIPYRVLGQIRALRVHDLIVARRLERMPDTFDLVHTWPLGALETLRVARRLGIPSVLERPNAHTRFAYSVVRDECERLGVELPRNHEHAYNEAVLRYEEEEYRLADFLLCPSDFVLETFLDEGYPAQKLLRNSYGFDPERFYAPPEPRAQDRGLTMLFVGGAAVRKGVHFALEAWLRSPVSEHGTFLIAGAFIPAYERQVAPMLAHPSVEVLGHRGDVADLMRASDVLVLPSIEEGSALVCSEAIGCGCPPLVSDVASAHCRHLENALIHRAGQVDELEAHITSLHNDRALLERLRAGALKSAPGATWQQAGSDLVRTYRHAVEAGPTAVESALPADRPVAAASEAGVARTAEGVVDA
jgi:glycosyltransferase involved in cell wall biosynthesis